MEKLSFLGVGPKIGRVALPLLIITIVLTLMYPALFSFGGTPEMPLLIAGVALMVVALTFYVATVRIMLPAIRANRLATHGTYRFCRNPLYAIMILFMIPGLALLLNSWLILTVSVAAYLVFRSFIHEEEEQLDRIFGEEFRAYRSRTPRFFPNLFAPKK